MKLTRNYSERILKDESHHQQLVENGYFTTRVLNDEELGRIIEVYEEFAGMIGNERLGHLTASCNVQNEEAVQFSKKMIDEIFSKAFDRIMIPNKAEFLGGIFLIKSKDSGMQRKTLHQDNPLVDETQSYGLYSWTPITDMDETTGKLFVVPKSNYMGPHQRSHILGKDPDEQEYQEQFKVLDIQKGETFFFDARLMHGSLPNTSGKDRVAVNYFAKPVNTPCLFYAQNEEKPKYVDVYQMDPEYYYYHQLEPHKSDTEGKYLRFLRSEKKVDEKTEPESELSTVGWLKQSLNRFFPSLG